MYKVFFNESFLAIGSEEELQNHENATKYSKGKINDFELWLQQAEISKEPINIAFITSNPKDIWMEFVKKLKVIEAAGGLVKNEQDKYLLIFRRGKWDLPKGKIDEGETIEEAALREVTEETGLKDIHIGKFIGNTYHIYRLKGKLTLKFTHWFYMECNSLEKLIPEWEEDIEKAEWLSSEEIKTKFQEMFHSIKEILNSYNILKIK